MKPLTSLSVSASSTNNYKGKPFYTDPNRAQIVRFTWVITGTVTGTLIFEDTDSGEELIQVDVGNVANQTDAATWIQVKPIYDSTDTIVSGGNISVTNSTTDRIDIETGAARAIRPKWTNATGTATVVVTASARYA